MPGDRRARVRDELLRSVDDPLVVDEHGARLDVRRIRSGVGLGQPEGAERTTRAQVGKEARLLLVAAEEVDGLRAERGVGAHRDRDRAVDASELLDCDRVLQGAPACPADLLGERDPHQTELAHLAHQLVGERLGAVELAGHRRDLGPCELADGALEQQRVVVQVEAHVQTLPNIRSEFERSFEVLRYDGEVQPSPPTRPALRARYDRRRELVVETAARVFAERGYDQTSVQELTEAMGLAAGGLYHYFESKQQLLIEICDQLMDPLLDDARALLARRTARPTSSCARSCGCGWRTSSSTATTCSSSSRSAT